MVPHCPILSTKLKRLAAEQVSFTLSATSFFSLPANPAMRIAKRVWCYKHSTLRMAGIRKANHLANDISASSHAIYL